jgi:hypothetical protein
MGIPFCSVSYRRNPKGRHSFPAGPAQQPPQEEHLRAPQNDQDKRLFIKDILLKRKLVWSLPDCSTGSGANQEVQMRVLALALAAVGFTAGVAAGQAAED